MGRVGTPLDGATYVLLMLSTFGGLGLPVLMELYDLLCGRRKLSTHARTVLLFSAGIYLAGFVLLFVIQAAAQSDVPWSGWRQMLATSSVESINARTAGMHFEMVSILPRAGQWVLMILMVIGASPGGTGGGLKCTTVVQLVRGAGNVLRGRPVERAFGIALVWAATYLAIVVGFLLALMSVDQELPADRQLFVIISAASNVGLSHDSLSTVGPPLYLVAGLMLVARIVPLAILWWMAQTTDDAQLAIG